VFAARALPFWRVSARGRHEPLDGQVAAVNADLSHD